MLEACFCPFSKAGIKNEFIIFSLGFFNTGWFSFHRVIFSIPEIKIKGLIHAIFNENIVVMLPSSCYHDSDKVQSVSVSLTIITFVIIVVEYTVIKLIL